jgi:hypothetical protein
MRTAIAAVIATLLLAAAPARAEEPVLTKGSTVAVWGILGWDDSAGLGVSGQIPVVPEGFIHDPGFKARDSLDVDFGLDYLGYWQHFSSGPYSYGVSTLSLHGGVIWNFWVTPKVSLYPKLGLGYTFAHYTGDTSAGHADYSGLYPELAGGVLYRTASGVDLRAELGWAGLKLGVGFRF